MLPVVTNAAHAARKVDHSDALDHVARVGLLAYGVVHLLIAFVAARLALGDRSGSADSTGALGELASQPFGAVLVWAVAVGLVALVAWRAVEVFADGEMLDRVRGAARGVVYAVLAYSAIRVAAAGGGSGGGNTEETMTARLLGLPAGRWVVVAVGVGIAIYAGVLAWRGISRKHAEELAAEGRSGTAGRAYLALGAVGHVAKGVAYGVVGGLVVHAGLTHDADSSGGLDQALVEVLEQPFGPVLLLAVAVGIGCFAAFCFARARHLSR